MKLFIKYCVYFIKHKIDVFTTYKKIAHLTIRDFLHENSTLSFKEYQAYNIYHKNCKYCDMYMKCDMNQIGLGKGRWAEQCAYYKNTTNVDIDSIIKPKTDIITSGEIHCHTISSDEINMKMNCGTIDITKLKGDEYV